MQAQRTPDNQSNPKQKRTMPEASHNIWFKIDFKDIAKKLSQYWHKTDIDINGIEDPTKNPPHSYSHQILNKGANNTLEKKQPLQQTVLGNLDIHL
jgi:hypothetical protein